MYWQWHQVFLLVLSQWSLEPGWIIEKRKWIWKSHKEGFLNIFFSINQPGSRLHRERTSKKTRCHCQYINIQIHLTYYYISNEISFKSFIISFFQYFQYFKEIQGETRADPGETTQHQSNSSIHPNLVLHNRSKHRTWLGGTWIFPMGDLNHHTIP